MAINNLTELVEVLKTDPTLQSVAVTRDGTSVTQLRINPIAFGINSQSTTATVSVTTEGLVSLQELPSDLLFFRANDTAEQVYTGAQTANNESLVESYSDAKVKAYLAINDGPVVGSTAIFSELAITDQLVVPRLSNGNIVIDNSTIISTESNSNIDIIPNGTGKIALSGEITNFQSGQDITFNPESGYVRVPTPPSGSIDTRVATTEFIKMELESSFVNPTFLGTVTTDSITIDNNVISTNITNASLELEASGTGQVLVKSALTIGSGNNLTITTGGIVYTNTLVPYSVSGMTIQGSTSFTSGIPNFQSVSQTVVPLTGATGVVTHNLSNGAVFFHSSISANFTANFTNVPTTDDRGIGVALILDQGGTGYLPTAVQINGASVTLRWAYNVVPTPSTNQVDTVSFTLIRTGATWYVIGQHTNFA